jgi:hypothetical protein
MKQFRIVCVVLSVLCIFSVPSGFTAKTLTSCTQETSQKKEIKVWVNTHSGVYHCPGTRWYGATKEGKYMSECEAEKAGYRPAYGKPCGSDCGAAEGRSSSGGH